MAGNYGDVNKPCQVCPRCCQQGSDNGKCPIFSSPEPKAQVSFSDQNLSIVRRCRRRCCRCRFTFSSSSPEPLDQFQPNLAQSILG